ncbi:MAG: hypothetical protein NTU85_02320 [Candidatus Kaiserbacteria bacterium]|nr:hypothetical protein [Candidatus Kaiserbacteria bacterium]
MKKLWLILLLVFSVGIFFSITHAGGKDPPKQASQKATPQKQAPSVAPQRQAPRQAPKAVPQRQAPRQQQASKTLHQQSHNPAPRSGVSYHGHGGVSHGERHDFRGHNYHHFSVHQREIWHSGSWRHDHYRGMYGWWWVVGGMWYFYPSPIYPYPQVIPEVVFEAPPVVVVESPVMAVPIERPLLVVQPQQQFSYWCDNPEGYAPYVEKCNSEWRRVSLQIASPSR